MKRIIFRLAAVPLAVLIIMLSMFSCDLLGSIGQHQHEWREATCTSAKTCELCGEVFGTAKGHSYKRNVTPPTCTNDGYTTYTCTACDESYKADLTAAEGHSESGWIIDIEPTVTQEGLRHTECMVCGIYIKPTEVIAPHEHDYDVRYVSATCTADGYTLYICDCGYNFTNDPTPALGHDYTGAPISQGNGTHTVACSRDSSHIKTVVCEGEAPADGESGICSICGGEFYFTASDGNIMYGFLWFDSEYTDAYKYRALYMDLWQIAENFAGSDADIVPDGDGNYVIGTADFSKYSLSSDEAMSVWKIFCDDSPSYYWLDNTVVTYGDELLLMIDGEYADADYRKECDSYISTMIAECSALISSDMTELERAVAIVGYIVSNMEYAYESDGVTPKDDIWAHSILGLAKYDLGVCETYAKSFVLLCEINDVDCILGSGIAGGPHAWNYVEIDGVWYGVDVTWTDNSKDRAVYDRFGMSDSFIHSDHTLYTSDKFGVDYHYDIPVISDTDMELAALYKDGVYEGLYPSIDDALRAIDSPMSEYEINIGFYSNYKDKIEHKINVESLPTAKKITVTGTNIPITDPDDPSAKYLDFNTPLVLDSALTLTGALEFKNLDVKGTGSIDLNGNELILGGDCNYIGVKITGKSSASLLNVNVLDLVYLKETVDLHKLIVNSGKTVFFKDSRVELMKGDVYIGADNPTVHIGQYIR